MPVYIRALVVVAQDDDLLSQSAFCGENARLTTLVIQITVKVEGNGHFRSSHLFSISGNFSMADALLEEKTLAAASSKGSQR